MCGRYSYPLISFLFFALASSVAIADDVRQNDTGGFTIYADDGRYIGRIVPNDSGGYNVRALDGRKVDSVDSTGGAGADLEILDGLYGEGAEED